MSSTHVLAFEVFCQRQVARIRAVNGMTFGGKRKRRRNDPERTERRGYHIVYTQAWHEYQRKTHG